MDMETREMSRRELLIWSSAVLTGLALIARAFPCPRGEEADDFRGHGRVGVEYLAEGVAVQA